jgi:hypothetical protein
MVAPPKVLADMHDMANDLPIVRSAYPARKTLVAGRLDDRIQSYAIGFLFILMNEVDSPPPASPWINHLLTPATSAGLNACGGLGDGHRRRWRSPHRTDRRLLASIQLSVREIISGPDENVG